jgi:hypothetical protein
VSHPPADYLALAQTLTTTLRAEVARFEADSAAPRLDRSLFATAITDAGFSPLDFPLLDPQASDTAFVDNLELLVHSLTDITWLMQTFGGTEASLVQAMTEFFASPLLPPGLPRPTPFA